MADLQAPPAKLDAKEGTILTTNAIRSELHNLARVCEGIGHNAHSIELSFIMCSVDPQLSDRERKAFMGLIDVTICQMLSRLKVLRERRDMLAVFGRRVLGIHIETAAESKLEVEPLPVNLQAQKAILIRLLEVHAQHNALQAERAERDRVEKERQLLLANPNLSTTAFLLTTDSCGSVKGADTASNLANVLGDLSASPASLAGTYSSVRPPLGVSPPARDALSTPLPLREQVTLGGTTKTLGGTSGGNTQVAAANAAQAQLVCVSVRLLVYGTEVVPASMASALGSVSATPLTTMSSAAPRPSSNNCNTIAGLRPPPPLGAGPLPSAVQSSSTSSIAQQTLLRTLFSLPLATLAACAATYGFASPKLPADGTTAPPKTLNKLRVALEAELIYSEVLAAAPPITVFDATLPAFATSNTSAAASPSTTLATATGVQFSASTSSDTATTALATLGGLLPGTPTGITSGPLVNIPSSATLTPTATSTTVSAIQNYLNTTSAAPSAAALAAVVAAPVALRQRAQLAIAAMVFINNTIERELAEDADVTKRNDDVTEVDTNTPIAPQLSLTMPLQTALEGDGPFYTSQTLRKAGNFDGEGYLMGDRPPTAAAPASPSTKQLAALLVATPNNISYLITQQCTELAMLVFRTMTTVVNFLIPSMVGKGSGKGVVLLYRKWLCDVFRYLTDDGEETMRLYSRVLDHYNTGNPLPSNSSHSSGDSGRHLDMGADSTAFHSSSRSPTTFPAPYCDGSISPGSLRLHEPETICDFSDVEGALLEGFIVSSGAPFDTIVPNSTPPRPRSAEGRRGQNSQSVGTPLAAISRLLDVTGSWKGTVKPLNLLAPHHSKASAGGSSSLNSNISHPHRGRMGSCVSVTSIQSATLTPTQGTVHQRRMSFGGFHPPAVYLTDPRYGTNLSGADAVMSPESASLGPASLLAHTLPAGANQPLVLQAGASYSSSKGIIASASSVHGTLDGSPNSRRMATPPPMDLAHIASGLPEIYVSGGGGNKASTPNPQVVGRQAAPIEQAVDGPMPIATRMLFSLSLPTGAVKGAESSISPKGRPLGTDGLLSPPSHGDMGRAGTSSTFPSSVVSSPAPSAALHLHSYRHSNIRNRSDVAKAYLAVISDAEGTLHPAHPVRASLVNNAADHMASGGNFVGALALIRRYLEEVAAEATPVTATASTAATAQRSIIGGISLTQSPAIAMDPSKVPTSVTTVATAIATVAVGGTDNAKLPGAPKSLNSSTGLSASSSTSSITNSPQVARVDDGLTNGTTADSVIFILGQSAIAVPQATLQALQSPQIQATQQPPGPPTSATTSVSKRGFTTSSASRGAGSVPMPTSVGAQSTQSNQVTAGVASPILASSPFSSTSMPMSHNVSTQSAPTTALCLSSAAAGITNEELEESRFILRMLQQAAGQLTNIVGGIKGGTADVATRLF